MIYLGKHRTSTNHLVVKNYISIGTISLFFNDLETLLSNKIIDEDLLFNTMGYSLSLWIVTYNEIDFRTNADDIEQLSRTHNEIHKKGITELSYRMDKRKNATQST